MADVVPAEVRSRMMAGIRSTNTKPEMVLRKGLHRLGFRFRLHSAKLPGKPDIVLPKYGAVLLAHGCFWHGHDCHLFKWPSTRTDFWTAKITRNCEVDAAAVAALQDAGWRVGVIWECALKGRTKLLLDDVVNTCAEWLRSETKMLEIRGR
ncbi:MAG: DNA mismatch endonuclease Vsr [Sphingomonas sp.]